MAPPAPWFTLNTDGASKGLASLASGGGFIRDYRGSFIRGFSANSGSCSAYNAEIAAAAIGPEMPRELGLSKLQLQMDNKACLEVLQNANHHGGECVHLLNACRSLINSADWEFISSLLS